MDTMSIIYVVCQDEAEAKKISEKLLKKKLCACTNIIDGILSMYLWQNKVQSSEETILLIKAISENVEEIKAVILENHSYEIPCIFSFDVDNIDSKYFAWMVGALK